MSCGDCGCYDAAFSEAVAARELRRYRRKGPLMTTRLLVDALRAEGVEGASLLDVGAGVGAVHHELLAAGARSAVHVDAAIPLLRAAEEETARRGHGARVSFHHGDFVALAPETPATDVVTLDRVICCYPAMEALVAASASRARRLYGVVVPRDRLLVRVAYLLANLSRRVRRCAFRTYVHPPPAIDAAIRRQGLSPRSRQETYIWHVAVYAR